MTTSKNNRNPYKTGSTNCLDNASMNGGQVTDDTDMVGDYDLKNMKLKAQNKNFRGAGGDLNTKALSPSVGGSVKSGK